MVLKLQAICSLQSECLRASIPSAAAKTSDVGLARTDCGSLEDLQGRLCYIEQATGHVSKKGLATGVHSWKTLFPRLSLPTFVVFEI